jgi:hypothetical protein
VKTRIVCRPSAWWRATLSLLLVALSTFPAGAAGPFPFEDVNNNGVWDPGVDRDITAKLTPGEWYVSFTTAHSIVIPAGVGFLKAVERFTGFYLVAGKNITVNSSMNAAVYAGMVDLRARGGNVVIGPGVVLTGRDYLNVYAAGDVTVGAGASFSSRGGSANLGTMSMTAQTGDIHLGSKVKFSTLRDISITALAGDITAEPGLSVTASQGLLFVDGRRTSVNGAGLRAAYITVDGDGQPLEFKNNRVQIPRGGYLHITNSGSSIDLTGTTLPRIEDISLQASTIFD